MAVDIGGRGGAAGGSFQNRNRWTGHAVGGDFRADHAGEAGDGHRASFVDRWRLDGGGVVPEPYAVAVSLEAVSLDGGRRDYRLFRVGTDR